MPELVQVLGTWAAIQQTEQSLTQVNEPSVSEHQSVTVNLLYFAIARRMPFRWNGITMETLQVDGLWPREDILASESSDRSLQEKE